MAEENQNQLQEVQPKLRINPQQFAQEVAQEIAADLQRNSRRGSQYQPKTPYEPEE